MSSQPVCFQGLPVFVPAWAPMPPGLVPVSLGLLLFGHIPGGRLEQGALPGPPSDPGKEAPLWLLWKTLPCVPSCTSVWESIGPRGCVHQVPHFPPKLHLEPWIFLAKWIS